MKLLSICLLASVGFGPFACSPSISGVVPPEDSGAALEETVDEMRRVVLSKLPDLSPHDRERVSEQSPRISSYTMAGSYDQFFCSWDVPSGRKVVAAFTGDIRHIRPEHVQVRLQAE